MFRVEPRATMGLIFLTVLIQKSEKHWKALNSCLKNLNFGIPSGHQTFPWGCAPRESLMTLGSSWGQICPSNYCGLSTVFTRYWKVLAFWLPQRAYSGYILSIYPLWYSRSYLWYEAWLSVVEHIQFIWRGCLHSFRTSRPNMPLLTYFSLNTELTSRVTQGI